MNGAASNPDANIFAYAASQVKKCMEISKRLGAENFGKSVLHRGPIRVTCICWLKVKLDLFKIDDVT